MHGYQEGNRNAKDEQARRPAHPRTAWHAMTSYTSAKRRSAGSRDTRSARSAGASASAQRPPRPSELPHALPVFDRFAGRISTIAGRAPFFVACVLIVVLWLPTLFLVSADLAQLTIQTVTAVITFLLVALLQNTQARADAATQHKLNELSDALANLIATQADNAAMRNDIRELKAAVGLEERERS